MAPILLSAEAKMVPMNVELEMTEKVKPMAGLLPNPNGAAATPVASIASLDLDTPDNQPHLTPFQTDHYSADTAVPTDMAADSTAITDGVATPPPNSWYPFGHKAIEFVKAHLEKEGYLHFFYEHVDTTEHADYLDVVPFPMSIRQITDNLEYGLYENPDELRDDVFLMTVNCIRYCKKRFPDLCKVAQELALAFDAFWNQTVQFGIFSAVPAPGVVDINEGLMGTEEIESNEKADMEVEAGAFPAITAATPAQGASAPVPWAAAGHAAIEFMRDYLAERGHLQTFDHIANLTDQPICIMEIEERFINGEYMAPQQLKEDVHSMVKYHRKYWGATRDKDEYKKINSLWQAFEKFWRKLEAKDFVVSKTPFPAAMCFTPKPAVTSTSGPTSNKRKAPEPSTNYYDVNICCDGEWHVLPNPTAEERNKVLMALRDFNGDEEVLEKVTGALSWELRLDQLDEDGNVAIGPDDIKLLGREVFWTIFPLLCGSVDADADDGDGDDNTERDGKRQKTGV